MNRTRIAYIAAVALAASLLLARVHPFGDAGLYAPNAGQPPIPENASIPPDVRALLTNKCADCHSTQTHAPIYAHFAPVSWLMERDIVDARRAMNLSQWDTYSADQQETFKAKIVQETKTHDMPLLQYRMIHWNARITAADIKILSQWSHGASAPATAPAEQITADGDPMSGKVVFEKRCTGCHSLTENREGPRLHGVYGRTTGAVGGFPYSSALKKANIAWNDQALEKWLADPDAFLPGNNMDFSVPKPQERKDLISFLKGAS